MEKVNSKKKGKQYYKVLYKNQKGESGKFLEYFFGSSKFGRISDIMSDCDNLYKLLNRVDLWTSNNLDTLREYIVLKIKYKMKKRIIIMKIIYLLKKK